MSIQFTAKEKQGSLKNTACCREGQGKNKNSLEHLVKGNKRALKESCVLKDAEEDEETPAGQVQCALGRNINNESNREVL